MQLPLFKKCTRCGETKLFTQFSVKKETKSGRNSQCKECCNAALREYNATPESIQQRKENRIKRRSDPQEVEKDRARDRERWDEDRKQAHNALSRKLYSTPEGKERHDARTQRYLSTDKGKTTRKIRLINRRSAIRGAEGSFSNSEWVSLCERYAFHCLCCGKIFPLKKLSADHVIPVSAGGSNDIQNIQPLCLSCNVKKGTKTIDYRPTWE